MNLRATIILFLLAAAPLSHAATIIRMNMIQDIDPADSTITREGGDLVITVKSDTGAVVPYKFPIEEVKKGKKFYHWTSEATPDRWVNQGGVIKPDELEYLKTPGHSNQMNGPGWYISSNPIDSASFGPRAVVTEMPEDFNMLKARLRPADKAAADRIFAALEKENIWGTQMANGTWHSVFDPRAASKITYLDRKSALDSLLEVAKIQNSPDLPEIVRAIGYQKHPLFTQYYPEFDRFMTGAPLQPGDIESIASKYFQQINAMDPLQRTLWAAMKPEQRGAVIAKALPAGSRGFASLIQLDQNMGGLPAGDQLAKKFPEIADLFTGKPLTDAEHKTIAGYLNSGILENTLVREQSDFARRLEREFAPEIRQHFAQRFTQLAPNQFDYSTELYVKTARSWGVSTTSLDPLSSDPGLLLMHHPEPFVAESRAALDQQGRNLIDSYGFLSQEDIAKALANGDTEPWKALDKPGAAPFIDRWHQTLSKKTGAMPDFYARLMGTDSATYRDVPLVTGGDVIPKGASVGYQRVSARELDVLRQNHLLKLDVIPETTAGGPPSWLVRYEHPSARTYKLFADKLSPALAADLQAADLAGKLADPANATSRALTVRVLQELSNGPQQTGLTTYQQLVAIEPFASDNETFARLWYIRQNGTGIPLVLKDPKRVLLASPSELSASRDEGDRQLDRIAAALRAAHEKGASYSDRPEVYESFFHSPVSLGDKAEHQAAMRAFFRDSANQQLLASGEVGALETKAWDLEISRLEALPADQKTAVLREWARANLRPAPGSEAAFRQLLDDSRAAATGADRQSVTGWWLSLANGSDRRYAGALSDFSGKLPSDLQNDLVGASIRQRVSLGAADSPELRAQATKVAGAIAASPTDPDRIAASHFLYQQAADHPTNPRAPFADVMRMLQNGVKSPDKETLLRDLLTFSAPADRAKFLQAIIQLPPGSVSDTTATELLSYWYTLPADEQMKVMGMAVHHPDSKFAVAAWQAVMSRAGQPEQLKLLADPHFQQQLRKQIAESPEQASIWQNLFAYASRDPVEQAKMKTALFQSLSQRKAWNSWFAMMRGQDSQLMSFTGMQQTTPEAATFVKEIRRELDEAIKESPSNASLAYYYQSLLTKDPAEIEKLQTASVLAITQADTASMPGTLQSLMQSTVRSRYGSAEGLPRLNKFTADVFAAGPDATRIYLTKIVAANELPYIKVDDAGMKALVSSLKAMSEASRAETMLAAVRASDKFANPLITEIVSSGDKSLVAALATVTPSAANPSRWYIATQAAAAADESTRRTLVRSVLSSRSLSVKSDAEADQVAKLIVGSRESARNLLAPEAAGVSVEARAFLLNERDQSALTLLRSDGDPDFIDAAKAALLRVPTNAAEREQLRAALAMVPYDDSPGGTRSQEAVKRLLSLLNSGGVSDDVRKQTTNDLLSGLEIRLRVTGNRLAQNVSTDLNGQFASLAGTDQVQLMRVLSHSAAYSNEVFQTFARNLVSGDPVVSQMALEMIAPNNFNGLDPKKAKEILTPYLIQYAQKNDVSHNDLFKTLEKRFGIDHDAEIAPFAKAAPTPATGASCSTAFSAIKP